MVLRSGEDLNHIGGLYQSYTSYLDHFYKLSFLILTEATQEIKLQLARRFYRRSLNIVDGQRMDAGPLFIYLLAL